MQWGKKEWRGIWIKNDYIKVPLFADDITVQVQNPKEPTKINTMYLARLQNLQEQLEQLYFYTLSMKKIEIKISTQTLFAIASKYEKRWD